MKSQLEDHKSAESSSRGVRTSLGTFVFLVVVIFIASLGKRGVQAANEAGWFEHTDDFVVYAKPDWITGEIHYCDEQVRDFQTHKLIATDILNLDCSSEPRPSSEDTPSRIMSVHYHGRFYWDETAPTVVIWKCVRLSEYIDCRVSMTS